MNTAGRRHIANSTHTTAWLLDLPPGKKYKLQQLQIMVKEDLENNPLTQEQEEQALQQVLDNRKLERRGARANNRAATLDANTTIARIQDEVSQKNINTAVSHRSA